MTTTGGDGAGADAAEELWLLPPGDLVAARDALARRLRAEGRRADAEAVARVRRPSPDAHAVNVLARREPGLVDALVEVGEELRRALGAGDAAAVRALVARRRDAVDTALQAALRLAPAARAAAAALRATLEAAVADPDLAARVRAGRLERGLRYAGLGVAPPLTRASSPAPGTAGPGAVQPQAAQPEPGAAPPARRLRAVRSATADRRAAIAAARAAVHAAEDDLTGAQLARAEAQEEVDRITAELATARDGHAAALERVRAATRERDRARAALARLERAGD